MFRWFTMSLLLLVGYTGFAQEEKGSGWYALVVAGLNSNSDESLSLNSSEASQVGEAAFDPAFAAGGGVGYRFSPRFKLESELLYRTSGLDSVSFSDGSTFDEGDFSSLALAVNLLLDFTLFGSEKARSFVGGGPVWVEEVDIDFEANGLEQSFSTDDIGYQLMAGISYRVTKRFDVSFDLRYANFGKLTMESEESGRGNVVADYGAFSAIAGFRLRL